MRCSPASQGLMPVDCAQMKKLLVLVAMAAALAACSKKEEAPAAVPAPDAAVAPEPTPAASAAAAPVASVADLPQECKDYVAKVQACMGSQTGAAADTMKSSLEQTKATWASMGADKAALAQACKAAGDAFTGQATAMKC